MCSQAVPCKLLGVAAVPTCVAMLENSAGKKKGRTISLVASGLAMIPILSLGLQLYCGIWRLRSMPIGMRLRILVALEH